MPSVRELQVFNLNRPSCPMCTEAVLSRMDGNTEMCASASRGKASGETSPRGLARAQETFRFNTLLFSQLF